MTDTYNNETTIHSEQRASGAEYSIPYILTQIAAIQNDTTYIHKALDSLTNVLEEPETVYTGSGMQGFQSLGGREINLGPGAVMADDPKEAAADAVKHVVMSRETTNQKLLDMYERMLKHLIAMEQAETDTVRF